MNRLCLYKAHSSGNLNSISDFLRRGGGGSGGVFIYHPAGDVTRVSVVQRKVTVKIENAENWWRGCRDKN